MPSRICFPFIRSQHTSNPSVAAQGSRPQCTTAPGPVRPCGPLLQCHPHMWRDAVHHTWHSMIHGAHGGRAAVVAGRRAALGGRTAPAHVRLVNQTWPKTVGQDAGGPFSVNIVPLLSCFWDLRERTGGPNMTATPAVPACSITRAPLLKIVRLVNQTNSRVPLLKDTAMRA